MTEQSTYQTPPQQAESSEIPIGQLFGILWRGRWIILVCMMLAAGAGIYHVEKRGTIYRATSRLYVDNQSLNVSGADMFLGAASRNYVNTQAELLRSAPILMRALESSELAGLEILRGLGNRIAWLKNSLKVSVGRKNDIISVTLDSKLRDDACAVVRQVVEEYRLYQLEQSDTTLDVVVEKLLQTKKADEEKLAELTTKRDKFLKDNGASGATQVAFVTTRYNNALAALQRVKDENRKTSQALNTAKVFADDPSTLLRVLLANAESRAATTDPRSEEIRSQIQAFDAQVVALRTEVTDELPRVIELKKRIEELRSDLAEHQSMLANAYLKSLEEKHKAELAEAAELQKQVLADEAIVQSLRRKSIEYGSIEADIAEARDSLKNLRDRFNAVNMNKVDKAADMKVSILDEATPETATVAAGKTRTVAILTLLGLLIGAGLAWLRGLLDHRIRTVEDVSQRVGIPVVGVMPRANLPRRVAALDAWHASRPLTEAARSLRTAVYFAMSTEGDRVLHVTSPDPGDGKSLTTSCLGIAMAQAGQKTLIIDADMRKPRQAAMFEVDNAFGLADLLKDPAQSRTSGIVHTDQTGLDLLPSGRQPENPAELLSSATFAQLLEALATKYDRILVDSPPVLPVADARILGEKCDFTLLVTRVDKSTVKRASLARDELATLGARILGGVINDMPKKLGYGYGSGYGYGGAGYGDPQPGAPTSESIEPRPTRIPLAASARGASNGSRGAKRKPRRRPPKKEA